MRLIRAIRQRIRLRARRVAPQLRLMVCVLAVPAFLVFGSAALAGDLDKVILFNIKAQTLENALLQFGMQAHIQVSVAVDSAIRRLKVPNITGSYTSRQALTILLKGTKLTFDIKGDIVEVYSGAASVQRPRDPASGSNVMERSDSLDTIDPKTKGAKQPSRRELQEVVVTGSRLPATSEYGPQEIQIYDSVEIEQSGQASVSDFLSTLPSVSVISPEIVTNNTTTVQLRGLPVGTTLVLLNGLRLESSGTANGQYFDLTNIPLAAVQRIEVDENGSSAVYGSDAIAGVVNVILKKDLSGFSVDARYGWAKDVPTWTTSLSFGKQWGRGGFSVIGSFERDGELLNVERSLSASNDYTNYGGSDDNYPDCFRANVFSISGAALPGAPAGSSATYAAVTGSTASGKPPLSQFTYGTLNECGGLVGTSILPSTQREGALVEGHFDVAPAMELFTEIMYTHIALAGAVGYADLFGTEGFQTYSVSASNPYNPFGTTVGVAQALQDVPLPEDTNTDFFRPLVGIRGTFARRWRWELSAWQSTDWSGALAPNELPNGSAIQSALNSSSLATALDPFVTGPVGSQALLESLFGTEKVKSMGRDRSAEAVIRGSVIRLPAGYIQAVIGGDYVHSTLYENLGGGTGAYAIYNSISEHQRTYEAAFGEVRVPIIALNTAVRSGALVTATISGRHDQYSDFGGATTQQFGLVITPTNSLYFRGSYGTAFDAPTLIELYAPQETFQSLITDPVTGAQGLAAVVGGGNPQLLPLTGRSHTIGVVYSSRTVPGLLLSATQWTVVESNAIQDIGAQVIVDNPIDFPGRVIRNSAGQIVEVDEVEANFGTISVAGVDYQLEYRRRIGRGVASIDLNATDTYRYNQALTPGAPSIESVSIGEDDGAWAPRWKGVIGLNWNEGSLTAHADGRYTSSYYDYDSTTRLIGNFWIFDTSLRWNMGESLGLSNALRGGNVEVGATNLFNRAPQFSNYDFDFYGYDAAQMSILGRSLYFKVGVSW